MPFSFCWIAEAAGLNRVEVFEPGLKQDQFLRGHNSHAHELFITPSQVVIDALDSWLQGKVLEGLTNFPIVQVSWYLIPKIQHKLMLISLLPNGWFVEENVPVVTPYNSLSNKAPPDIRHTKRTVGR